MSRGSSWYAEKMRKVRKHDAAVSKYASNGEVSLDYLLGRKMFPPETAWQWWEWVAFNSDPKHVLEPRVLAGIAALKAVGIDVNVDLPTVQRPAEKRLKCAVYYANGSRRLCDSIDEALTILVDNKDAVKVWDCVSKEYLVK